MNRTHGCRAIIIISLMITLVRCFRATSEQLWRFNSRILSSSRLYSAAILDGQKRVVFLGTPEIAASSLQTIYQNSKRDDSLFEIVGVVTQPPKRRKRRGKPSPSPVGLVAQELGIPILCPEKANDKDFLNEFEYVMKPDLCITAAYGQYLPKRFLATPTFGTVNIHPSLLPRWRGASPVQRSLEAGDTLIGVTVLFTVSKMDAGPIIAQEEYSVSDNDYSTTVLPELFEIGTEKLLEAIPNIFNGKITMETAMQQDESQVKEAGLIDSSEAQLKVWEETSRTCHNRVRGFSMWPGTFIYVQLDDQEPIKIKILESKVLDDVQIEPTQVIEIGPKKGDGLRLVCGDGSVLEILKLQPAARNAMDAKSFVNGLQGRTPRWVNLDGASNS